jgi:hypothetical protein
MAIQTFGDRFAFEVKQLIEQKIVTAVERIVLPPGSASFEQYRHDYGVLEGLRRALDAFEEAESRINEEDGAHDRGRGR